MPHFERVALCYHRNNSFKSSFLCRLHPHLTWIDSDYVLVVPFIVLLSQFNILHFNLLPLQTDDSHSFGVDLVESFDKLVCVSCSET